MSDMMKRIQQTEDDFQNKLDEANRAQEVRRLQQALEAERAARTAAEKDYTELAMRVLGEAGFDFVGFDCAQLTDVDVVTEIIRRKFVGGVQQRDKRLQIATQVLAGSSVIKSHGCEIHEELLELMVADAFRIADVLLRTHEQH